MPAKLFLKYSFWMLISVVAVALFFLCSQDWDLRHTGHIGAGLLRNGLSYYSKNEISVLVYYLPSIYVLTQIALLPSTFVSYLFGIDSCSLTVLVPCTLQVYTLKLVTVLLAFLWVRMVVEKNRKLMVLALLALPTVLYPWLAFGAYDSLGAFAALIGGVAFFKSDYWKDRSVMLAGILMGGALLLAALGVGAKYFPLPLFVGCALAYSKSIKRFWIGMVFVLVITAVQIFVTDAYGGRWHDVIQVGKGASTWWGTVAKLGALIPVLTACGALFLVYIRKGPSLGLGALAALSSYALLLPTMWPHPQWYFYYGLALAAALAVIPLSQRARRYMLLVLIAQGVSMAMGPQWLLDNTDITMMGRAIGWDIHSLSELYPDAHQFIQKYGRKGLTTTLLLSWAIFAYEWWQVHRKARVNGDVEESLCDVNTLLRFGLWSGAAFLLTWMALFVAVVA